jgi:uncharacterized protein YwlG (UPF0340 family)
VYLSPFEVSAITHAIVFVIALKIGIVFGWKIGQESAKDIAKSISLINFPKTQMPFDPKK